MISWRRADHGDDQRIITRYNIISHTGALGEFTRFVDAYGLAIYCSGHYWLHVVFMGGHCAGNDIVQRWGTSRRITSYFDISSA